MCDFLRGSTFAINHTGQEKTPLASSSDCPNCSTFNYGPILTQENEDIIILNMLSV